MGGERVLGKRCAQVAGHLGARIASPQPSGAELFQRGRPPPPLLLYHANCDCS